MKEKLLISSAILFGISALLLVLCYFMFHYLGEDVKFHKEFSKTVRKPFITNLVGTLASFLLGSSVLLLILALVVY